MKKNTKKTTVEEFAKNVRALYEVFPKEGFTTEQAFNLTLLVVQRH